MNKQRHHYGFGKYTLHEALGEALIRVLIFVFVLAIGMPIGMFSALGWDTGAIVIVEGEK